VTPRLRRALLLAPAVLVLGGLFLGGLGFAVLRSLNVQPAIGLTEPSLSAWAAALAHPGFWPALRLSLWIAGVSTALALVLGFLCALLLREAFPGRGAVRFLLLLNLTVPHVVAAVGILYLVGQAGALARIAHAAGLIAAPADFPALVFDPAAAGIIIAYVWKEVPFVALVLLARMQVVGRGPEEVARSLGATRLQALRHALIPHLRPAGAIIFAFAFGAWEVPALLGASRPEALPMLAWRSYTAVDLAARPQAMAMALVIAAVALGLVAVVARATRGRM
jgi:putative spermidine/putrescine transport system permease protein